jgi:hypothetical protein
VQVQKINKLNFNFCCCCYLLLPQFSEKIFENLKMSDISSAEEEDGMQFKPGDIPNIKPGMFVSGW